MTAEINHPPPTPLQMAEKMPKMAIEPRKQIIRKEVWSAIACIVWSVFAPKTFINASVGSCIARRHTSLHHRFTIVLNEPEPALWLEGGRPV